MITNLTFLKFMIARYSTLGNPVSYDCKNAAAGLKTPHTHQTHTGCYLTHHKCTSYDGSQVEIVRISVRVPTIAQRATRLSGLRLHKADSGSCHILKWFKCCNITMSKRDTRMNSSKSWFRTFRQEIRILQFNEKARARKRVTISIFGQHPFVWEATTLNLEI